MNFQMNALFKKTIYSSLILNEYFEILMKIFGLHSQAYAERNEVLQFYRVEYGISLSINIWIERYLVLVRR